MRGHAELLRARARACALIAALWLGAPPPARAQEPPANADVARGYELEATGRYRDAARAFRLALATPSGTDALLGLERMYAELRMSDSLLPVLDSVLAREPRNATVRAMQLRTLQLLRRDDLLGAAFESWARVAPRDPGPYREYARALLALGQPARADSVVARGRRALGTGRGLALETAQLRAAQGQWVASALAWRVALEDAPYLATAASFALAPAPAAARDSVRDAFTRDRALAPREALAGLELGWGRPSDAWEALRAVLPDTAAATAWTEFGERALAEGQPALALAALQAALSVRPTRALVLSAATAAVRAREPARALALLEAVPWDGDSSSMASDYLPLRVTALGALGRAADADALVARHAAVLRPAQRERLAQAVAFAWVRSGDLARARAALAASPGADSSDAAGWLALYEGRLRDAARLLRVVREPDADLAMALGVIARIRDTSDAALGDAFLRLARGDSLRAAEGFVAVSGRHVEAAPALLLAAARIRAGRGDEDGAIALWTRLVNAAPDAPEASEAELEWARALRRRGDRAAAIAHLEHLIIAAPRSALLPQARRDLDLARAAIPQP